MTIVWHFLVCRMRGHDLVPLQHPNFPSMAILRCRRCHQGAHLPNR